MWCRGVSEHKTSISTFIDNLVTRLYWQHVTRLYAANKILPPIEVKRLPDNARVEKWLLRSAQRDIDYAARQSSGFRRKLIASNPLLHSPLAHFY